MTLIGTMSNGWNITMMPKDLLLIMVDLVLAITRMVSPMSAGCYILMGDTLQMKMALAWRIMTK